MAKCRGCTGPHLHVPIADRCPLCLGSGYVDDAPTQRRRQQQGCFGTVFGFLFMGLLAFGAFTAIVVGLYLFKRDSGSDDGLKAAARGMPFTWGPRVGDCHPEDSWEVVSCDVAHASQLYALVYVDADFDAAYPGSAALERFGRDACRPLFSTTTGESLDALGLFLDEGYPREEEWDLGVRQILCGAIAVDGTTLTGSLPLRD